MEHVQCNIHWNFFVLCFPDKFLYFFTSSYKVSLLGLHTGLLHSPRMRESGLLITETSRYFRQLTLLLLLHPPLLSPQQITPFNTIRWWDKFRPGGWWKWSGWAAWGHTWLLGPWFLHLAQGFGRRQKYLSITSAAFSPDSPQLFQAAYIHPKLFLSWEQLACTGTLNTRLFPRQGLCAGEIPR